MLNEVIFNMFFVSGFLSTISTSIPICLKWSQSNNNLRFVCRVDGLYLPITLKDPSNTETAFCYPQVIGNNCYKLVPSVSITHDFSKNETLVLVDTNVYSNINGQWTCQHGTYGDSASVIVNISSSCIQESSSLNGYYWILSGFVPVYWASTLFEMLKAVYVSEKDHSFWRVLNKKCCMKRFINKKHQTRTTRVLSALVIVFTVIQIGVGVIFNYKKEKDTIGGQIGLIMYGALNAIFLSYVSATFKDLRSVSTKEQEITYGPDDMEIDCEPDIEYSHELHI